MIGGIPLGELAFLAAVIIAGGIVTGILAGLFGIGGGAIIVPVLYEVFRVLEVPESVRMQLCVGTSMAIIVPTNVRSFLVHRAHGAVLMEVVRAWTIPSVVGVAVGALIAGVAPGAVLKIAFVVITGTIGLKLLIGRDDWRIASRLPGRVAMAINGFILGLGASLIGVSGGSISAMILTLYGTRIHNVVATAAAIGVPITIAGVVGYALAGLPQQALMPPLSIGFVSLIGFALMAPVSSLTAPFGARLAHALPKRRLEIAFAAFLLLASSRFLLSLVW
ncbi:MAG: sulfite exporter TauE/SafE family protein [Xanthobacteraceae bacterium]|nr:sulfite exporter TauE/SafE family protein [Xanthobacteraceae bacterium]